MWAAPVAPSSRICAGQAAALTDLDRVTVILLLLRLMSFVVVLVLLLAHCVAVRAIYQVGDCHHCFDLAQICVEPLFVSGAFVQVELVDIPVRRATPAIPFAVATRRTRWSPMMQDSVS